MAFRTAVVLASFETSSPSNVLSELGLRPGAGVGLANYKISRIAHE